MTGTSAWSSGREVRELPGTPSLTSSYLRAVRQRPGKPDRYPEQVLRLSGVTPDPARVAAYAELCGYRFGNALPALYPHLLGFPLQMVLLTDARSPFPAMGLVHVRNEVSAEQPVPPGRPLDVEVKMEAPREHRKGRTVDLVARALLDGVTVWSSTSTYLRRGKPSGDAPAEPAQTAETAEPAETAPLTGTSVWRLPAGLGREYAAISGDRNPIHMSALSARPLGFRTAIAHGMWTAARCLGALEGRLPDAYRFGVEFRAPVPLPSTVEYHDLVGEKETRFELRSRRKDRLHLTGLVTPL